MQGKGVVSDASDNWLEHRFGQSALADVDVVVGFGKRRTQLRKWGSDKNLKVIGIDTDYPEIVFQSGRRTKRARGLQEYAKCRTLIDWLGLPWLKLVRPRGIAY